MKKPTFKEDLLCNITLICTLVFSGIHLLLLTLNLLGATNFELYANFNYVIAYIMVIASLVLYILGFYVYHFTRIHMPAWFRMLFYIAFFLFTNVYYILNWFNTLVGLIFFYAYISFLACIISLSVYFNSQKDDKNKLKIAPRSLITSVFFYAIAGNAIIQFVVNLVKIIAFPSYEFSTLPIYIVEFGTMIAVTALVTIAFSLSLARSKTFINACLIKVYNR